MGWECKKVSARHSAFFSYFCRKFCGNRTMSEQANFYDRYYGRPARITCKEFREATQRILNLCEKPDNWNDWVRAIGLKPLSAKALTKTLRNAVKNSKRRGYTNSKMQFHKIH